MCSINLCVLHILGFFKLQMSLWHVRYASNLGTFPVSHRTFWVFVWFHCIYSFRFVYVWDTNSRRILYKLPGHDGSVNDVDFHPNELICECTIHSWFHHWSIHFQKSHWKKLCLTKMLFLENHTNSQAVWHEQKSLRDSSRQEFSVVSNTDIAL